MLERNKITIKMVPHETQQSTKMHTKHECTQELIETTIAATESHRQVEATLVVTGNSAC